MVGLRFGALVCIAPEGADQHSNPLYRFRCDCGREIVRAGCSIRHQKILGRLVRCGQCARLAYRAARSIRDADMRVRLLALWASDHTLWTQGDEESLARAVANDLEEAFGILPDNDLRIGDLNVDPAWWD